MPDSSVWLGLFPDCDDVSAISFRGSSEVLVADGKLHSRGGRRSSVSEPPESHWLASGGSLTLDHQPPNHCGSTTKFAEEPFLISC